MSRESSIPEPSAELASGESDFVNALVEANQRFRGWRERLEWVRSCLARETPPVTPEQLVDVAIYLRFLATGQLACAEDGRHFRPSHHARIAQQIRERLAQMTTPANAFIARKIYPLLPSSAAPFQRAEPLTRIRDIAHRNDIPAELKREIKHTLQNKLHRCAGPEDLATSAGLLTRITAPGANYSPDFVEQFKIFHGELREFFNARSLEERLSALLSKAGSESNPNTQAGDTQRKAVKTAEGSGGPLSTGLKPGVNESGPESEGANNLRSNLAVSIQSFLEQKNGASLPEQLRTLATLTELRGHCLRAASGPPNPENQEFLLADIGLEDFAFVLLSEMLNALGAAEAAPNWPVWLQTLSLTLGNLALSEVQPEECAALESELRAWSREFNPAHRDQLLRLKATADRALRLAEGHSEQVLALFPPRVEQLGRALGVAEHAVRVFCEAEIRGHLIFQFSKLASHILRHLRRQLALPPWDVLVSGRAVGRLQRVETLEQLGEPHSVAVVVLRQAEGDEEIPKGVAGIILAHDLPHLSHLGVRARQAGVVLVTSEEAKDFPKLQGLEGKTIWLEATPEKVEWGSTDGSRPPELFRPEIRADSRRLLQLNVASIPSPERFCVGLENLPPGAGGGKAEGAKKLDELTRGVNAGFKTPPALVIPLGVMEAALRTTPELAAEYESLARDMNRRTPEEFEQVAARLREIIQHLEVPEQIVAEVRRRFDDRVRLMVRSSANCEDLAGFAAAGLYESAPNVAPADVASAVRTVWASLWSRQAALSRQQADIPHQQAQMAVLIQPMLTPDFSFVLHTVNPLTGNASEVYAEVAVGLGEALVSGALRGTPYRFVCDKQTGTTRMLAFANFSQALWPGDSTGVTRQTVNYSQVALSCDVEARAQLGSRLASVARQVEDAFQRPQDIEGVVVADEIWLVQARPQQGLGGNPKPEGRGPKEVRSSKLK